MQEYISIYNKYESEIKEFLNSSIEKLGNLHAQQKSNFKDLYRAFPALELIYIVSADTMHQVSENIYRDSVKEGHQGKNRGYLLKKFNYDRKNPISISKPYLSSATGETCISVIAEEDGEIFFLDFNLSMLLQRLGFIEIHDKFDQLNKFFYGAISTLLITVSVFIIAYTFYKFFSSALNDTISMDLMFKPIISLTLALAIFDLAKTILEQEVFFKSYAKDTQSEYKVLTKFIITIIIALLIEALMLVFKIALHDYTQIINALYLISAIALIIVSLAVFIKFTRK